MQSSKKYDLLRKVVVQEGIREFLDDLPGNLIWSLMAMAIVGGVTAAANKISGKTRYDIKGSMASTGTFTFVVSCILSLLRRDETPKEKIQTLNKAKRELSTARIQCKDRACKDRVDKFDDYLEAKIEDLEKEIKEKNKKKKED